MTRPPLVAVIAVSVVVVIAGTVVLANTLAGPTTPTSLVSPVPGASLAPGTSLNPNAAATLDPNATPTPVPTPRPIPKHETYGFIPYWEMDDGIAAHVRDTALSTVALFSVTNKANGSLATGQNGYRKIDGPIGRQIIRDAHDRKARVELVYTSFGYARNKKFFGGKIETQDKVIKSLVKFADDIGVDGINVDVELLEVEYAPAYGAFVGRLRDGLLEARPKAQVSVATTANIGGATMAAAAAAAGADRIFMMAYDYHWAGSAPGASSPMDRRDGTERDLVWSLDLYETMGVPVDRTLLGLPLYGMRWPVAGPELGAPETGRGDAWFPRNNVSFLHDPKSVPTRDPIEVVEMYADQTSSDPAVPAWEAIYIDSPETLSTKLGLADERGLAGAGFWAIGYERGLPEYTKVIKRFHAGKISTPGD
jgi:spore germination protein YaaH